MFTNLFLFFSRKNKLNCFCKKPELKKVSDKMMFCKDCDAIVEIEFCEKHKNSVCSKCHCKSLQKIIGGYVPFKPLDISNPPGARINNV